MKLSLITFCSSLLVATSTFAVPPVEVSQPYSLSSSILEIQAAGHADKEPTTEKATPYRHQDEQNNSLARGALAKQGVPQNIVITSMSQISTDQYDPGEDRNSLLRAALSKHYKETH